MPDLRVGVYTADEGGCGHYRLLWPARALAGQAGIEVLAGDAAPAFRVVWSESWAGFDSPPAWVHAVGLEEPPDVDVVVLQRPLTAWRAEVIPHLQAAGVAVVVEIDDDFAAVDYRNVAWPAMQPRWVPRGEFDLLCGRYGADRMKRAARRIVTWTDGAQWVEIVDGGPVSVSHAGHVAEACRAADLVTVSTRALAGRYGAHGRVAVLPNYVPRAMVGLPRVERSDRFGWGGSVFTHRGDLAVMGDTLRHIEGRFVVVGTGAGVEHETGRAPDLATGPLPLADYQASLGLLSVGVAPLADTAFNRAKSWLKPLEYAARGVPSVVSPLPEYEWWAGVDPVGCRVVADGTRRWRGALRALLGSDTAWQEASDAAHAAASRMTVEDHAWRWAEAWARAATVRASTPLAS